MDQFNIGDVVMFWAKMQNGMQYMAAGTIIEIRGEQVCLSWNATDEKHCPISGLATIKKSEIIKRV